MPKNILINMDVEKGKTRFRIYFDKINDCLVLKPERSQQPNKEDQNDRKIY